MKKLSRNVSYLEEDALYEIQKKYPDIKLGRIELEDTSFERIENSDIEDLASSYEGKVYDSRGNYVGDIEISVGVDKCYEGDPDVGSRVWYEIYVKSVHFTPIKKVISAHLPSSEELEDLRTRLKNVDIDRLYEDFVECPPALRNGRFGTDDFTFLAWMIGKAEPIKIAESFGRDITKRLMEYLK
ncbi:MAG TPA: hypothetical protein P5140_05530 [Methanofastidiosum sp.]|nr:hypothetical protein [Methanofastidiosum sp.]